MRRTKTDFGVIVNGKIYEFEYEEMVELLAAGRDSMQGNEYLAHMKDKAGRLFIKLPDTAY